MPEPVPLDLSPDEFARLSETLLPYLVRHLEALSDMPAQDASATGVERWRDRPAPEHAAPLTELCDFLFTEVVPRSFNTAGPGYLAFIPGGGLLSAGLADLIGCVVNRYTGVYAAAPPAVEVELQALRWLGEILDLPRCWRAVTTTGGSMSAWLAAIAARERWVPNQVSAATAYVSIEAHHTIERALRLAGVAREHVRVVDVDRDRRLRIADLQRRLAMDRAAGLTPFFVCGTAGTVNTGVIDPLAALGDIARRERMWFHVDAAYGGAFAMLPELRARLAGQEHADSWMIDAHKGLFLPYGTGVLFVRDLTDLYRAFEGHAAYLPARPNDPQNVNFCDHTPELSRDWRGLRLWLPFALHGVGAFRAALREKRRLSVDLYEFVAAQPEVEVATPPELTLFAFRQRPRALAAADWNRHNNELLQRINASGRILLTGTLIAGEYFLRACVLHLRTHARRVEEACEIIGAALRA